MADQDDQGLNSPAPDADSSESSRQHTSDDSSSGTSSSSQQEQSPADNSARTVAQEQTPEQLANAMAEKIEESVAREAAQANAGATGASAGAPLELPNLSDDTAPESSDDFTQNIQMLDDVELDVKIELGRSQKTIEEVLQLTRGSVVELDRLAGDPVDILVNDRLVARGEVLVLNENLCVRVSEILTRQIDMGRE